MKNLTVAEQTQLENLLAKKEAGEKLDKRVQEAVEDLQYNQERLVSNVISQAKHTEMIIGVYNKLSALNPQMFTLVRDTKTLSQSASSGYKNFTPEELNAAFKYLDINPVLDFEDDTVEVAVINVIGLDATVIVQAQEKSSAHSYRSRITGKIEFQLKVKGNYENQRWLTVPASLVTKVLDKIADINYKKAAALKALNLKDRTIILLNKMHPTATSVKVETKYSYSRNTRGKGYEYSICEVVFAEIDLVLEYRFNDTEKGVKVSLQKTNFNLLAALVHTSTPEQLMETLTYLKKGISNK